MNVRVIIIDDEPLAREGVAVRLTNYPDFTVVGEGGTGAEALALIRSLRPDLVFLDIQMPDMNGIEVLEQIDSATVPQTIFLTAFDRHAVAAFQVQALDYLLKPIDDERFETAIRRARRQLELEDQNVFREQVMQLIHSQADVTAERKATRFAVRIGAQLAFVRTPDIDWIEGNGDYASLHVGKKTYLLRQSLQSLEAKLDENEFVRVHRSAIVQVDRIRQVTPLSNRDCELTLVDGTELRSSRTYSKALWDILRRLGL